MKAACRRAKVQEGGGCAELAALDMLSGRVALRVSRMVGRERLVVVRALDFSCLFFFFLGEERGAGPAKKEG